MDLGLNGRIAVVCASSHGLGRACATELAHAGCTVVVNGRNGESVDRAAKEIRLETGGQIIPVAVDISTREGREQLLGAVPQVDILVNNNGGPPFRDFRHIDDDALMTGVLMNMATPIDLVQRVIDGMIDREFGRIVNITSASVKMPLPGLDLSSGARVGLTGFLAGVARSVAYANVTINFLLPGSFETRRLQSGQEVTAAGLGVTREEIAERDQRAIPARRFGRPAEFGAACAFLCSAQAGFITGQSILLDGGAYPGIF
jgi:3-oxoacyl-[acyl-carrier protein] reductase